MNQWYTPSQSVPIRSKRLLSRSDGQPRQVLFISPTPALSPLLQSQGIPHMRELGRLGVAFTLMSYEDAGSAREDASRAETLAKTLYGWGIQWHPLRLRPVPWRPRSMFEVLRGAAIALWIIWSKGIELVHVRSYLPAYMMLIVKLFTRVRFVFDMRGLLPDEYVENGYWRCEDWQYRFSKWLEGRCLVKADQIIATTPGMAAQVEASALNQGIPLSRLTPKLRIIPNLTDLSRFIPDPVVRDRMRAKYGLANRRVLLWSVGGIASWHLPREVVTFFRAMQSECPDAFLLVLTRTPGADSLLQNLGLRTSEFLVLNAPPEDVSAYLQMGDLGISIIEPHHSASAVKLGEYLACGLPVVIDWGQTDIAKVVIGEGVGVVIQRFDSRGHTEAARGVLSLLSHQVEIARQCRRTAELYFSLAIAVELYGQVYADALN